LKLASPLTPVAARVAHADDVIVQFVRSGGAGGQNVNKGALQR
jgi:protein subunit release factor B